VGGSAGFADRTDDRIGLKGADMIEAVLIGKALSHLPESGLRDWRRAL
jgi:hypothetical protein